MKKLSTYLFLILFSLSAPSKADDIRDFQIEGMSIGDSLLDYFTKEEIENKKNSYADKGYIYPSKEYYAITFNNLAKFEKYQDVQFNFKDGDENYKIYNLMGIINYPNNISDCYKELNSIENEFDELFKNSEKQNRYEYNHKADETGKSKVETFNYKISSKDYITVSCADWSEEMDITDALRVEIRLKIFNDFIKKFY